MSLVQIAQASDQERDWAASLFAGQEPWITLGSTLEQCRSACRHPEYRVYVARREGQPCGAIVLHPRGVAGSPYVKSLAVAEGHRGQGTGAALVKFAEDLFRGESRHIFLCVSSFNTRARAFYERLGYLPVGEFKDYVIVGASEILMHKLLRQPK